MVGVLINKLKQQQKIPFLEETRNNFEGKYILLVGLEMNDL